MIANTVDSPCAWTAHSVGSAGAWRAVVEGDCLAELDTYLSMPQIARQPTTSIRLPAAGLPLTRAAVEPVRAAIDSGRGFVIVDGLSSAGPLSAHVQRLYWLIGQMMGTPIAQDIAGTLLYSVTDTGRDVRAGARFSVTNAESTFHTDGAFNPLVADCVGLLSLQRARSGGRSQLVSAVAVHDAMLREHPGELSALYEVFCFDRRGQFAPGEPPFWETSVFSWDGAHLRNRFMRTYIEVGHELAGRELTRRQMAALDAFDHCLQRQEFRVEFDLEPGQMLFTNNHLILHNRTAFVDHSKPQRRRHLVRLWLTDRGQHSSSFT